MKTAAIILSAGKGTRFGGNIPKQYVEVAGKPVLAYSLESFEKSNADEIYIVSSEDSKEYIKKEIIEKYGITKAAEMVTGGSERYFSVLNALRAIKSSGCDIVLIHDGARPFITTEGINTMIKAVSQYGAAVAASKAKDTVKITDENGFVCMTTVRADTWMVATPQCFKYEEILGAYEKLVAPLEKEMAPNNITDDSYVFETVFPEKKVKLIEIPDNSKITTAGDLDLMKLKFEGK